MLPSFHLASHSREPRSHRNSQIIHKSIRQKQKKMPPEYKWELSITNQKSPPLDCPKLCLVFLSGSTSQSPPGQVALHPSKSQSLCQFLKASVISIGSSYPYLGPTFSCRVHLNTLSHFHSTHDHSKALAISFYTYICCSSC